MSAIGTIEINRLRLHSHHGVLEQERVIGNNYEVTVHLHHPIDIAMQTDNLNTTINYADVVQLIKDEMNIQSLLLENIVHRIKTRLTTQYPKILGGYIKVAKLTPPITAQLESVAISLKW